MGYLERSTGERAPLARLRVAPRRPLDLFGRLGPFARIPEETFRRRAGSSCKEEENATYRNLTVSDHVQDIHRRDDGIAARETPKGVCPIEPEFHARACLP